VNEHRRVTARHWLQCQAIDKSSYLFIEVLSDSAADLTHRLNDHISTHVRTTDLWLTNIKFLAASIRQCKVGWLPINEPRILSPITLPFHPVSFTQCNAQNWIITKQLKGSFLKSYLLFNLLLLLNVRLWILVLFRLNSDFYWRFVNWDSKSDWDAEDSYSGPVDLDSTTSLLHS